MAAAVVGGVGVAVLPSSAGVEVAVWLPTAGGGEGVGEGPPPAMGGVGVVSGGVGTSSAGGDGVRDGVPVGSPGGSGGEGFAVGVCVGVGGVAEGVPGVLLVPGVAGSGVSGLLEGVGAPAGAPSGAAPVPPSPGDAGPPAGGAVFPGPGAMNRRSPLRSTCIPDSVRTSTVPSAAVTHVPSPASSTCRVPPSRRRALKRLPITTVFGRRAATATFPVASSMRSPVVSSK